MDDRYDCLKIENQLCFPLYVASKEIVRKYKPLLDILNLTYTQYIAMMVLWEKKEVTVSELGKALFLDSGTISPLIRKLQEKGYVDLSNDKSDERITHVILSEEGLSLREKALRVPEQIGSCIHLNTEDALNLYRILYQIISDLTGEENRYDK